MLRKFISSIVQTLPMPQEFQVAASLRGLRKVLQLQFYCSGEESAHCVFPSGMHSFSVQTSSWAKWLKVLILSVKLGVTVGRGVTGGGDEDKVVATVKRLYQELNQNDGEDFTALVSSGPFMASSDRDKLVVQLKGAGFFDVFSYDSQREGGGWLCSACDRGGEKVSGAC